MVKTQPEHGLVVAHVGREIAGRSASRHCDSLLALVVGGAVTSNARRPFVDMTLQGKETHVPNALVAHRLAGIRGVLTSAYCGGIGMSSASKGKEREFFVDNFLSGALPPPFRVGNGDITDASGAKSGQLDIVVEFPFLPSLPILPGSLGLPRFGGQFNCVTNSSS